MNNFFWLLFSKDEKLRFRRGYHASYLDAFVLNHWTQMPGIWPLVDENFNETPFVTIGTKGGMPKGYKFFMKKYKKYYTFIYNFQNGPYTDMYYNELYRDFAGVFDLDFAKKPNSPKSMFCVHSMMTRSLPIDGFFWEPTGESKEYDFSILTWGKSDKMCKRWDRARIVCDYLCSRGLKGLVVTQRGDLSDITDEYTKKYIKSGQLAVYVANFSEVEFHKLMCKAKIGIFPNVIDAFPKNIMETILADKPIVAAKDLLLGSKVLGSLGEEICLMIDFENDNDYLEKIYQYVKNHQFKISPRKFWLERYGFDKLSEKWAEEINRVFGTKYKKLFYLNHVKRIKDTKLLLK